MNKIMICALVLVQLLLPRVPVASQAFTASGATVTAVAAHTVVAFTHVNVVPMDRNRVLQNMTVIVRDGRIAAIGPSKKGDVPIDAVVVDATGKYLMPGLADMHTHVFSDKEYLLYVSQGVTTIRNMWGFPSDLEWRAKIVNGEKLGPTIYTAGSILDGDPPQLRGSTAVGKPEDADAIVKSQKEAGYDFIKVYNRLKPDVYDAIMDAANKYGIRVVGHVPRAVGLEHVIARKQASVEHMWDFPAVVKEDEVQSPANWTSMLDEKKMRALAKEMRVAGVWNCPTLGALKKLEMSPAEVLALFTLTEFKSMPPQIRRMSPAPSEEDKPMNPELRRYREMNRSRMVKFLRDAGARLLMGTDTGSPYLIPGISAHEELQLLVAAGLSPYEALRAGTRDAAEFLNGLNEFGTISIGKRADLILLDANPLDRIENTRLISGVMVRRQWLASAELKNMLKAQAASYNDKK